ncbi:MAG: hypothetical protein HeimC3_50270 [Candidatus Heimdallarchaeota archaeon LC_3]|nr:MAG: hypothetical protein HeimC3_50270 [Candidatus Heimdallarchaeota archaeon LC_3]
MGGKSSILQALVLPSHLIDRRLGLDAIINKYKLYCVLVSFLI